MRQKLLHLRFDRSLSIFLAVHPAPIVTGSLHSIVKFVRLTGGSQVAQPNYTMNRRREFRASSSQYVTVTNLSGVSIPFLGQLRNTSPHGLGLRLALPFETNTAISVEWKGKIVLGHIAYCLKSGGKYHAGLETEYLIYDRNAARHSEGEATGLPASR